VKSKRLVFMNNGMHFWNREKDIVAELNKEYEILLIICHDGNKNYLIEHILNFCKFNKIKILIIDNTSRKARNFLNFFRAILLTGKMIKYKPTLIYIENFSDPYFAIFSGLFLSKSKVIISIMDYELHPYERNKKRLSDRFYKRIYLKFFKNFQVFSSEQASLMRNEQPSKTIFYIPLYLIKNDYTVTKKINNGNQEFINFLFLGNIHYYKGIDILIKAGNTLSLKYKNFKIVIGGYCNDFSKYENLIENKNIFELKIYYLSKKEIQVLLSNTDVLVLPYRQVTQSGPLMMAFNFGIIPLASDLKGFQELIDDGYNGFLFTNNSLNELVKAMEKILLLSNSDRERIRTNLVNFVSENYSIPRFVNNYKLMFETISDNS